MGSTSEKGIIKTAKTGRRRWCTAVDLYFAQVQYKKNMSRRQWNNQTQNKKKLNK
jgi:hypothetical protein